MSQKINHLYRLVTVPWFYMEFQKLLGSNRALRLFHDRILSKYPFKTVLDVGCGPAPIRPYLGECDYFGVDLNKAHIDFAKRKYSGQGTFECRNVANDAEFGEERFDLILCIGLLHHLEDKEAMNLLKTLAGLLAKGGRLVTLDPVYIHKQNWLARKLNDLDSGQNVRNEIGYQSLFPTENHQLDSIIYDDLIRLPYNHCCNVLVHEGDQK